MIRRALCLVLIALARRIDPSLRTEGQVEVTVHQKRTDGESA